MNRKGQCFFTPLALAICFVVGITISQTPMSKKWHRAKKAELVCQGAKLGYTEQYNDEGKKIASLVDVINENEDKIRKDATQDIVDYCSDQVSKKKQGRNSCNDSGQIIHIGERDNQVKILR